jgi:hypothetical protein
MRGLRGLRQTAGVDPVSAHLEHLRQRGLSPATIATRRRALARLGAALPVPLARATPADLAAWTGKSPLGGGTAQFEVDDVRRW